jgi:nucleoside-diphosphate-sugar epimerase
VIGSLLTQGTWQDEAAANWVFHLSPYALDRRRLRIPQTQPAAALVRMDGNLLDAIGIGSTRRIVYVADAIVYGAVGRRPITEDEPAKPSWFGDRFRPALDRLDGYALAGLPIITALPGLVFGNGSWLRRLVVDPLPSGRRVLHVGGAGPLISPIHVHDCVRALLHLVERGEHGSRYFLVNHDPVRFNDFAGTCARVTGQPVRAWCAPPSAARLVAGPALAGYLHSDAVFANIRLRGTGFRYRYPTLEDGLREVVGAPA